MHLISFFTAVTRSKNLLLYSLLLAVIFNGSPAAANTVASPQSDQAWSFSKALSIDPMNISGIVVTADFMVLATDEGHQIQLFRPLNTKPGQQSWQPAQLISLDSSSAALSTELDIEGLAWHAPYLYAIGSHSIKRAKLKGKKSAKQNLKRLHTVIREPARQQLFRIELDGDYKAVAVESLSLAEELESHPILGLFAAIPSKENGVDIEGLAIDAKGRLLVGFRGPVLHGNIATVLRVKLHKNKFKIKSVKSLYLPLSGRGIRGISEMGSGFLLLTGAVGDQALGYQLYHWEGKDLLPSHSVAKTAMRHLCELPPSAGKPEGIQFLQKTVKTIEFVIVQDGLKNGEPSVFSCPL